MIQLVQGIVDTQKHICRSLGRANAGDDLKLELEVRMNEQPITFINPTCELLIKKPDNNKVRQTKDILYQDGKFKIKVDEQGVTYPGIVTCQLVINDEGRVSTCLFYFTIGASLDREILQSISKVETLEQLDEYVVAAFSNLDEYEKRLTLLDSTMTTTNEEITANESERKSNEIERKANEIERKANETLRVENEKERVKKESERSAAEIDRKSSELDREKNENARRIAENTRIARENARENAEINRNAIFEENEAIRNEAEKLREKAETKRKENFNNLETLNEKLNEAEKERKEAEQDRISKETERQLAEAERERAEANREKTYTSFNNAEVDRKNGEDARIQAEASRVQAENVRSEQFEAAQSARETKFQEVENNRDKLFKANETARATEEIARIQAESTREGNEAIRVNSESLRVSAEKARQQEEIKRGQAEIIRAEAEKARELSYEEIKKDNSTFKTEFNKAVANVTNGNENATNSEIVQARGKEINLNSRLDKFDEQLDTKANEVDLIVERNRINLLTKTENSETEGNTELLDIRNGANGMIYDLAGEAVRDAYSIAERANKNMEQFFVVHKSENISEEIPLTLDFSSESGWLHKNLHLKTKKWINFKGVYVALEIECIKLDKSFNTNSISVVVKNAPHQTIKSLKIVSDNITIVQSQKYIVEFWGLIPEDVVNDYTAANMLMIQFGNQNNIGNPILKINNIFIQDCNESDLNELRDNLKKYGFKGKYLKAIKYKDILPDTRPKINGIELTPETKFSEFNKEIKDLINTNMNLVDSCLYSNKAKNFDMSTINMGAFTGMTLNRTVNDDGSVSFEVANINNGVGWVYTTNILLPDFEWVAGHKYLIALKGRFDKIQDNTQGSAAGNFGISNLRPAVKATQTGGIGTSEIKTNLGTIGTMTNFISLNTIDGSKLEQAANKNAISLQLDKVANGVLIKFTLFDICVLDATELELNDHEIIDRFNEYEYIKNDVVSSKKYNINVSKSDFSSYSEKAGSVDNINISTDIEIWGDSLVAQGYGKYIGEILGRNVLTKGYGGKTSTYIRDKFLAEANVNKMQIINVGRNNYNEIDVVIQDIREMVATIPHNNFLICCPPNGNYGEGIGTSAYERFKTIEERLRKQYQSNFLNTREATIQEYDMGNVKLLSNFIQPQVGQEVTIKVSNAKFLVTYNTNDMAKWGQDLMRKVAIGMDMNKLDIYSINSYDLNNNTLTITLVENNSGVTPGSSVGNKVDGGGLNSLKYIKVLQNADYYCWKIDTTQSTFRMDGIHMAKEGLKCQAKVVARKINTMKI